MSTLIIPVSPLHPELCAVAGLPEVCTGRLHCVNLHVRIKSHSKTLANQRASVGQSEDSMQVLLGSILTLQVTFCDLLGILYFWSKQNGILEEKGCRPSAKSYTFQKCLEGNGVSFPCLSSSGPGSGLVRVRVRFKTDYKKHF